MPGATALSNIAADLEKIGQSGSTAGAVGKTARIEKEYKRVIVELENYLRK